MNTLTKTTKYENLSLTELKALVEGAKNGEVDATERLCNQFKYMIKEEVGKSYIRGTLGEDAENDAWVLFLEAVNAFDKKAYSSFPSFVKKYVHYRILNVAFRKRSVDTPLSLDSFKDDFDVFEPADPKNWFSDIDNNNLLEQLFSLLTDKQRLVLQGIANNKSLSVIAEELNVNIDCVYAHKKNALKLLRTFCRKEHIAF